MTLKEIRIAKKITQMEASEYLSVSLRSYKDYENNPNRENTLKYKFMIDKLQRYNFIDEENGILTIDDIKSIVSRVFEEYDVSYCYLFGSYARNEATEISDVDLLVSCNVDGLNFFGLIEKLRTSLCKRVDLLGLEQLDGNYELTTEILKDGIKIYERKQK
jgi:predicted nucleotidyltransferase